MSTEVLPEAIEPTVIPPVKSGQLAKLESRPEAPSFESIDSFRAAQSMALALCKSSIVPVAYQGEQNMGNVLIALDMAMRARVSVMAVMQNMHVIHGKPGWGSPFLIGQINSCGRFTPLRFEFRGEERKSGWGCRAYATEKATGEVLQGTWITWDMAQKEGWVTRKDSKWATMPEQMIVYRAASFWSRVFAPDISLGMHTVEELEDITPRGTPSVATQSLNAALREVKAEEVLSNINPADVPCPECGAKPFESHTDICGHNPFGR